MANRNRGVRVSRDGNVHRNGIRIGLLIREVDGWSPADWRGDYLGTTVYPLQSDARNAVVESWVTAHKRCLLCMTGERFEHAPETYSY